MSQIINESTRFEIYWKTKLNGKHKGRGHGDNVTKRVNIVNLPKLEISKFIGDPTKWQSFFNCFRPQLVSQQI